MKEQVGSQVKVNNAQNPFALPCYSSTGDHISRFVVHYFEVCLKQRLSKDICQATDCCFRCVDGKIRLLFYVISIIFISRSTRQ